MKFFITVDVIIVNIRVLTKFDLRPYYRIIPFVESYTSTAVKRFIFRMEVGRYGASEFQQTIPI